MWAILSSRLHFAWEWTGHFRQYCVVSAAINRPPQEAHSLPDSSLIYEQDTRLCTSLSRLWGQLHSSIGLYSSVTLGSSRGGTGQLRPFHLSGCDMKSHFGMPSWPSPAALPRHPQPCMKGPSCSVEIASTVPHPGTPLCILITKLKVAWYTDMLRA